MNNNIDDYIYERFLPTLLWLRDYMGFNHASESQGEGNRPIKPGRAGRTQ